MRLLYLVDHWPGLFEAYLLRELQWMRQRGHSVAVLSLGLGGAHGFRNETRDHVDLAEFGLDDVPVLQLDSKNMDSERVVHESLSFIDKYDVELIDAHLAREPAEAACRVHLASGIPFAVRMRGGDVHSNTSPMLAEIVRHASAVCPMSQFLADVLIGERILTVKPQGLPVRVVSRKLHVIPNSLPEKYLSARPVAQSNREQVVGAVGRLVPIKRFPDLIAAVARPVGFSRSEIEDRRRWRALHGVAGIELSARHNGPGGNHRIQKMALSHGSSPAISYLCANFRTGRMQPGKHRGGVPRNSTGVVADGCERAMCRAGRKWRSLRSRRYKRLI